MVVLTKHEYLRRANSVEKLFQHHFRQNFGGHQKPPNRAAFVDCRAFSEVSIIGDDLGTAGNQIHYAMDGFIHISPVATNAAALFLAING